MAHVTKTILELLSGEALSHLSWRQDSNPAPAPPRFQEISYPNVDQHQLSIKDPTQRK